MGNEPSSRPFDGEIEFLADRAAFSADNWGTHLNLYVPFTVELYLLRR